MFFQSILPRLCAINATKYLHFSSGGAMHAMIGVTCTWTTAGPFLRSTVNFALGDIRPVTLMAFAMSLSASPVRRYAIPNAESVSVSRVRLLEDILRLSE